VEKNPEPLFYRWLEVFPAVKRPGSTHLERRKNG
jgi:hypothetical protein